MPREVRGWKLSVSTEYYTRDIRDRESDAERNARLEADRET